MVGTKMIFFAIIGLVVIGAVNFVFFKTLKKTFKDRKLIWFVCLIIKLLSVPYVKILIYKQIMNFPWRSVRIEKFIRFKIGFLIIFPDKSQTMLKFDPIF